MNLPPYGDQFRRTNSHLSSLKVMPSPDPDMFVNISSGGFWLTNKVWKEYVGGRSPGFTAPTDNAKWDLLCIHYNGNPLIIPGTPSTDPVLPNLQRKAFPLAAIYLEAGDTKITSEKIFDLRLFGTTSFSHVDFEDRDQVDSHPITAITGLRNELDQIESGDYWTNVLTAKADTDGTPDSTFTLNKDFTGTPSSDCGIIVERGVQPNAEFKFNETNGQWEYTNNGTDWVQLTDQGPAVVLPIASTTVLGGIKVGSRLTINPSTGVLDANIQSNNDFSTTYKEKVDSIEPHATQDMTPSEIKTSYESNIDTNGFTDAEKTKLAGIEDGATAGTMSNADIKVAYETNSNTNAFTDTEKNKLATVEIGAKADMTNVEIKASYESNTNTNVFTDAEKTKLLGVATGANAYVHPASHPPSIIVQDSNNRFSTDAEKTTWNNKADATNYWSKSELGATGGSQDRVDWSQLQNIPAFGSADWLNPVANIAARDAITGLQAGQCVLVQDDGDGKAAQYTYNGSAWVKIGDVDWSPMTDAQVKISYENNADTNVFTDAEKTKLGTVETDANNFTLDPATDEVLGGVMIGTGLSIDPSGLLELDYTFDDTAHGVRGGGNLHQIASTSQGGFMSAADKTKLDGIQLAANAYVLPSADNSILGGVKIGDNINYLPDGTISVPTADAVDTLGLVQVKSSSYLSVAADGGIDVPFATGSVYGVVQIGSNIDISAGVISVSHASGAALGLVKIGDNIVLDDLTGEISVDWTALPFDDTMHGTRLGGNLHALATESLHGFMSSIDKTKINGIEDGATGDMTAGEIKTSYESNADTNAFTDALQTKLTGIEAGATGDMTAGEVKAAYESNTDTNAFTDSLQTKLNGIEASANNYVHPATHPSIEIDQPVTKVVSVDGGRVDSYTADGSLTRPYKTIQAAIDNAPSGKVVINIAPNTYTENLVITDNKHLISLGPSGLSSQITGTVLYNCSGGIGSSLNGFIITAPGVNPTLQFYGTNPQKLTLDNCQVLTTGGSLTALHMNNSGSGSILIANRTEFKSSGSGMAVLVQGSNKFKHSLCIFSADNNSRCLEQANTSTYEGISPYFGNQVKISDSSAGELYHPIVSSGAQDCFQNDGLLSISAPVNLSNVDLISSSSTGITNYLTKAASIGLLRDSGVTDWNNDHIVLETAIEELLARIVALEGGGGSPITWYSVFSQSYWDAPVGNDDGSWSTEPEGWSPDSGGFLRLFAIGGWATGYAPTNIRVTFTGTAADIHLSMYNSGDNQIEDITVVESGTTYPIDLGGSDIFYMDMTQGPATFFITNIEFDVEAVIS